MAGKAESLPGPMRNNNLRFVVTSLSKRQWGTREVVRGSVLRAGEMENGIKELQLDLFADRTATATMPANQLRLHWTVLLARLMEMVRSLALAGAEMAQARFGTNRTRLPKVAARVEVSVRRTRVPMPCFRGRPGLRTAWLGGGRRKPLGSPRALRGHLGLNAGFVRCRWNGPARIDPPCEPSKLASAGIFQHRQS